MKAKLTSLFEQYNVSSISADSREVKDGCAFFAIKGEEFDGNNFIKDALNNGAIVFTEERKYCQDNSQDNSKDKSQDKVFYVENVRLALSVAAGIIYPKLPESLLAVTGTNGKTSVVSYIYQILNRLNISVATIGTLGVCSLRHVKSLTTLLPSLTTLDPISFRKTLDMLANDGVQSVAFEASSHGISQHRLGDVKVQTAGFTSFSQDHLDYHQTMEAYLQAKLRLFVDNLANNGEIVINAEILNPPYGDIVKKFLKKEELNCCLISFDDNFFRLPFVKSHIQIIDYVSSLAGFSLCFNYKNKAYRFSSPIIGSFQVLNLLIAAKMVENLGVDFERIVEILGEIKPAPGRLERVNYIDDDLHIFVDYAHTPDALEKSLLELKKIKAPDGKIHVVFGCGGDRDPYKRPLMGQVATRIADYVIVTDDNPRRENPEKIRLDILAGAKNADQIAPRELAIETALKRLKKNDILLIAGKGHENYQIIGDKTLFFSDIEIVENLCKKNRQNQS